MILRRAELLADGGVYPNFRIADQLVMPFGFRLRPAVLLDEIANAILHVFQSFRLPNLRKVFAVLVPVFPNFLIAHGHGFSALFGQLLEQQSLAQLIAPLFDGRMALAQLFLE